MIFTSAKFQGAYVIDIERREDHRGFFARTWCAKEFQLHGLDYKIVQINTTRTVQKGTLRGLHFQVPPHEEVKIVRCTKGALYDVIIDLRPDSPTYKQWLGVELTAENHRMLYVPAGFAHGSQTLEDDTELLYLTSQFYAPESARGVRFDDPTFAIQWPLKIRDISEADRSWPDYCTDGVPYEETMK